MAGVALEHQNQNPLAPLQELAADVAPQESCRAGHKINRILCHIDSFPFFDFVTISYTLDFVKLFSLLFEKYYFDKNTAFRSRKAAMIRFTFG